MAKDIATTLYIKCMDEGYGVNLAEFNKIASKVLNDGIEELSIMQAYTPAMRDAMVRAGQVGNFKAHTRRANFAKLADEIIASNKYILGEDDMVYADVPAIIHRVYVVKANELAEAELESRGN